jgi:exopolyphosphatase/guanosine-5'-triphosphate,3'-diphosphate pyrophosphatase
LTQVQADVLEMNDEFKGFTKDIIDPNALNGIRAAIDIGTNTVLLLVAEIKQGKIKVLKEFQRIPRLGRGVDASGNLDSASMERTINVLIELRDSIYESYGVIPVILTGTSAVRDASNRVEFLRLVEEATGYRLRILSPKEEAEITFKGALSDLNFENYDSNSISKPEYLVIDIGGGSTEIAFGYRDNEPHTVFSINMGSVRFTERYIGENPPKSDSLFLIRTEVNRLLSEHLGLFSSRGAVIGVGVAGTAVVLWHLVHRSEDLEVNSGVSVITLNEIDQLILQIAKMTTDEILEMNPKIMNGRADVILAGAMILQAIMTTLDLKEIKISEGGIRHGSLLTFLY